MTPHLVFCLALAFIAPQAPAAHRSLPAAPKPKLFLLVDFPYQLWSNGGTKIHLVAYTPRMRPARRAAVWLGKRRLGFTDRYGAFVFKFKARSDWKGGDLVVKTRLRGVVHQGSIHFTAYRRTSSFAHQRVYLYTDRGIYRPGDTLRARVLAFELRDRYHPMAGKKAVVTLRSPWGEVVRRQKIRLDAFGTGHLTMDLRELEPVLHTLTVRVGRATHSRTVKLAHFKRPALEIRSTLPRWFTARSPHLAGGIRLIDVEGRSPKGGRLTVTVRKGKRSLATRHFPLDGRLRYVVAFTPLERQRFTAATKVGERLELRIHAQRSDGTTATSVQGLKRLLLPFTAVVELDKDDYRVGRPVVALVKLTDPDEMPVPNRWVTLVVGKHTKRLRARTNRHGVATFRFRAPTRVSQRVDVRAFVPEVTGAIAEAAFAVKATGALESRLGRAQVMQHRWVPVTVSLAPGFVPLEQVLHGDVTDYSGAIVETFALRWRRTGKRWVARGRFRAPSWGTMLLTLYGIGARVSGLLEHRRQGKPLGPEVAGVLLEGQQVTVHPDQALRLTLSGVPRRAKPGTMVKLGVVVRGPDGSRRNARVGAALVDANILALGDPLAEVKPVPYFYNPRLRVMATTGSKMLTWPVVARNWTCNNYDIALPPFSFAEGGPAECHGGLGLGGSGSGGAGARGYAFGMGEPPRFTLRRRFEATSWWAPALLARLGHLRTGFRLPDAISRQVLLVVASDKQGRVGVTRRTITVIQDLSLELDLPPSLIAGDELEVVGLARNRTGRPLEVQLRLKGRGLRVLAAPRRLTVPPGRPTPFRIRIRAARVGQASLDLVGAAGRRGDAQRRTLRVRLAGPPVRTTLRATARNRRPARFAVTRRPSDQALYASVAVDYPNVLPALASVQQALRHPSLGGDSWASLVRTAALVLRYADRLGVPDPRRERLRAFLRRGADWLLGQQLPSGAYAYWRLGRSDAYHTAYVVETLLDLREAGIQVNPVAIRRAAWWLLAQRAASGLWDVSDLAFWEGRRRDVRTGLAAEIFRAVARASSLKCKYRPNRRLVSVARKMEALIRGGSRDPRTLAAATDGLLALYRRCPPSARQLPRTKPHGRFVIGYLRPRPRALPKAERDLLGLAARRLLASQHSRHWEPSWFSAWGGNLEAHAAAMRVLWRLDRHRYAAAIRRAYDYLVSRRASWGEWHNERGTAASLRALLEVSSAARPEVSGAWLEVRVNGHALHRVKLDSRDPWRTARALSYLRITGALRSGRNRVEVRYHGALKVPVRLLLRRWPKAATRGQPRTNPPGKRVAPRVTLVAPDRVPKGRRFAAKLIIQPSPGGRGTQVALRIPSTVGLDPAGLRALRSRFPWLSLRELDGVLRLAAPSSLGIIMLRLPLRALRRGRSHFGSPTAASLRAAPPDPAATGPALHVQ